jgi:hypothetical protein
MPPSVLNLEARPEAKLCIRLPHDQLQEIQSLAAAHNVSLAKAARALLRCGLDAARPIGRGQG